MNNVLEFKSHRSGQTLCRIKLLLDCYRSRFDVLWNNWMTIILIYYIWNHMLMIIIVNAY